MKPSPVITEAVSRKLRRSESESEFMRYVIDFLRLNGWRVSHTLRVVTGKGHRTCVAGDHGFPDVVASLGGRIAFLELKSDSGRLSGDQVEWLNNLAKVSREPAFWNGKHDVPPHVVRADDGEPWDVLVGVLRPRWAKGGSGWFETTFTMIPGLVI